MVKSCLFLATFLLFSNLQAQVHYWGYNVGGDAMDVDELGNSYVSGKFSGSGVDFDPGPGTIGLSSSNGTYNGF